MEKYQTLDGYRNEEGQFDRLPGKRQKKKLDLMIKYLAEQFDSSRKYTEKEVNEILNRHHSFKDPATLRRLLFGTGFLQRTVDGRSYWRERKEEC